MRKRKRKKRDEAFFLARLRFILQDKKPCPDETSPAPSPFAQNAQGEPVHGNLYGAVMATRRSMRGIYETTVAG
ncbi:MAG TPA: hypothetical protein VGR81_05135 [Candidatus Acidoferrales bacterium]|nr:hypothetical protein [Candidatus Acidoferrales bacterium]